MYMDASSVGSTGTGSFVTSRQLAYIPRANAGGQEAFNKFRETDNAPLSLGAQKRVEHFGLIDPLATETGKIDVRA